MSEHHPETSIVIRAFNEERWLPEVLKMLEQQRYRDFEIVLVDSGSVDRTRDIAAAAGARIVRLRSEDFTFGHSLNVGIREARGTLHRDPLRPLRSLSMIDWLERLIAPLRQDRHGHGVWRASRAHTVEVFRGARFRTAVPAAGPQGRRRGSVRQQRELSRETLALWQVHPFDEGLPGLEDIEWAKHWVEQGLRRRCTSPRRASFTCTPSPGLRSGVASIARRWPPAGSD